ncbi:hypothetical protein Sango_0821100 [Sesamum angolense]|uniref:Uncharacterized protein n=1 Tax=Sesamum angolense TaxID=2727404 RepID=A0AAE2C0U1_9LAMI|nr:hypothetical protein Sango_0821100 [Sesamum angolense]
MFEDIFKLPNLKKTYERGVMINAYMYNRPPLLDIIRDFTKNRDMVRPAKTRFATAFLTLKRFHVQKGNLRKMFTCERWTKSSWLLLDPEFYYANPNVEQDEEVMQGRLTLDSDEENATEFEDDDLTWGDVARVAGIHENAYSLRSQSTKEPRGTSNASSSKASKKASSSKSSAAV